VNVTCFTSIAGGKGFECGVIKAVERCHSDEGSQKHAVPGSATARDSGWRSPRSCTADRGLQFFVVEQGIAFRGDPVRPCRQVCR